MTSRTPLTLLLALVLLGCQQQEQPPEAIEKAPDPEVTLAARISDAQADEVIDIAAGRYELDSGLSIVADGVTLRGAGMNTTVLSFKNQTTTAAGLTIKSSGVVLEDIGFADSKGAAIEIAGGRNHVVRRVRTAWTGGAKSGNGTYGIKVAQAESILIEDSVAVGASAAGIYIGQSNNVVVRNSRAESNVAAIELDNTRNADLYNNTLLKNSSGILLLNLPDNPQASEIIRVHDNKIFDNNRANFGAAGTASAAVATGSGIVINAADRIEIFGNYIADNKTANIIIGSYFTAGYFSEEQIMADGFDPYPEGIFIHANKFSGGGEAPEKLDWEELRETHFGTNGSLADIVWDGYINPAKVTNGKLPARDRICVDNSQAGIVNIDAANNYAKVNKSMRPHHCMLPKLPAIELPNQ